MKVLQINTVSGLGSTGRIVTDLAIALCGQGDECYVAFGQRHSTYANSFKIGTKIENHLHNLGSRLFDKQGFFTVSGTNKLIDYIKNNKPDVIHLHNLHGNYLNLNILFKFLAIADIPVIWTLHDCWAFTGHCGYFDFVDCNKWETQCNKCPNIHSYPPSVIIDASKSNFEKKKSLFNGVKNMTIVTPSAWLAGLVKQSFLSKYDVQIINNGIDTAVFNIRNTDRLKTKLAIKNEIILLGVAAKGFGGRKGLKYFIEMANMLDPRYKLILIGISKSDRKKIPENIIGIESTDNIDQLAEYYSLADIFINPTLEDNFPTTNLEALACGTPVITFNTGGSPEPVDKETGIVIDKKNSNSLLNAVTLMNRQFKLEKGLTCREKAVNRFDKKRMYEQYIQLYIEKTNIK